jgi:hypothetical protein
MMNFLSLGSVFPSVFADFTPRSGSAFRMRIRNTALPGDSDHNYFLRYITVFPDRYLTKTIWKSSSLLWLFQLCCTVAASSPPLVARSALTWSPPWLSTPLMPTSKFCSLAPSCNRFIVLCSQWCWSGSCKNTEFLPDPVCDGLLLN